MAKITPVDEGNEPSEDDFVIFTKDELRAVYQYIAFIVLFCMSSFYSVNEQDQWVKWAVQSDMCVQDYNSDQFFFNMLTTVSEIWVWLSGDLVISLYPTVDGVPDDEVWTQYQGKMLFLSPLRFRTLRVRPVDCSYFNAGLNLVRLPGVV